MAITMAEVARDHRPAVGVLTNDPITGIGERQFKATDAIVSAIDVDVMGVTTLARCHYRSRSCNQPNNIHIPSKKMADGDNDV